MTTEQARALGILSGLQGQPAVWRHTAAAYPVYLVAWQQGHSEAAKARIAEQRARTKAQAQARAQGIVALSGGALFGDDVPQRVWGKARVVSLPAEECDQVIARTLAEAGRIPDRLDIALRKAHVREQELRRGRDYSHGGRGG